jgi:hypothetical protein
MNKNERFVGVINSTTMFLFVVLETKLLTCVHCKIFVGMT